MDELLLDTTYLLPLFGINVGLKNFEATFAGLLDSHSVLYNPASLVEAKWIVLGLRKKEPRTSESLFAAYRRGLSLISAESRLRETPLTGNEVEMVADELLSREDVKDYFDRIIYGTSVHIGSALLTEDEQLTRLGKRIESPLKVLAWRDLLKSR